MHKIARSSESSIPDLNNSYFSRVEDQNVRFRGAVSSPVNRIRGAVRITHSSILRYRPRATWLENQFR